MTSGIQRDVGRTSPIRNRTGPKPGAVRNLDGSERRKSIRERNNEALLLAYKKALVACGRRLPASPLDPQGIWWAQVARESGVDLAALARVGSKQRMRVESWLKELGVEARAPVRREGAFTLDEVVTAALGAREKELRDDLRLDRGQRAKRLNNLRWALNKTVSETEGGGEADARESLRIALDKAVGNVGGAGKLREEIKRCLPLLDALEGSASLPGTFSEAFRLLCARAEVTPTAVARVIGVSEQTARAWARGRDAPTRDKIPAILRLERHLGAAENSLTRLIRHRTRRGVQRRQLFPVHVREDATLYRKCARLMPDDFAERPEAERTALIADAERQVGLEMTKHRTGSLRMRNKPYILLEWPEGLAAEWKEFVTFRTVTRIRYGTRRKGKPWTAQTVEFARRRYGQIFGVMSGREPGMHAIPPEQLTFALLALPQFAHSLLDFRLDRMADAFGGDGYLTDADMIVIGDLVNMFESRSGWLRQRKDLAEKLQPISELVDETFVAQAKRDWDAVCDHAHAAYKEMREAHKGFLKRSRDPHEGVSPILRMPNPFAALAVLTQGVKRNWNLTAEGTRDEAIQARHVVMAGILSQTALRRTTLSLLDWRPDGSGHVQRAAGKWSLAIPRSHFKNKNGPYFQTGKNSWRDYERELLDEDGLYAALDSYLLQGGRERLAQTIADDALFPSSENGIRLSPDSVAAAVKHMTREHLAWNPARKTGIAGVFPFGPHAFRHILATAVLKASGGDRAQAAKAIHDSVDTVEQYLRYVEAEDDAALVPTIARGLRDAAARQSADR